MKYILLLVSDFLNLFSKHYYFHKNYLHYCSLSNFLLGGKIYLHAESRTFFYNIFPSNQIVHIKENPP